MCPESLGFGCCPNGYECGATVCIPPKIIPPKTITESDRTITLPAEVHTKTMVVTKAADMPISIKVQPTLFSSTSSPTATSTPIVADEASSKTQKSIRSVGIAVGVCVGILVIGFLAVLTYRSMKKRGNSDAFAIGRDHRYRRRGGSRLDLAAPTTNAFDPNGPQLLPENRYQRFSMRTPQVSQISGFDFGFHGQHGYLPHIPEEAHYGDSKYAPIPLDTPPTGFNSLKENAIEKREELYDTSVAKDSSQPLHEMEGDKPVREPAYARHLKKLGFRRSGGAGGGTDF